jgi:hypothetical protein
MIPRQEHAMTPEGRHRLLINHGRSDSAGDIFNDPTFLELHAPSAESIVVFELEESASEKIIARCHFSMTPEGFRSPIKGTYGGYEFLETLPGSLAEVFILKTLAVLEGHRLSPIEIVTAPFCYGYPEASAVHNILVRAGFTDQVPEMNFHREVRLDEKFSDRVNRGNVKRLRKAVERKLSFSLLERSQHEEAYRLIADNRQRRGFPMTMSWAQLRDMEHAFPQRVHFMAALDGERMVASSVCIDVRADILYVFYWADAEDQQQLSPVTFLAQEIYGYCQQRGYRLMDLGISTDEGLPNWGLVGYKENLGFSASLKVRYRRDGVRG